MIKKRLLHLKTIILADINKPILLARSVALGIYIAFSPFVGLHTVLVFLFGWLFASSIPIVLAVSLLVNNPWTMIFVYSAGYITGSFFCSLFNVESFFLDHYLQPIVAYIPYIETTPSVLFKFLVGGNVLGMIIALLVYPFVKYYAIQHCKKL